MSILRVLGWTFGSAVAIPLAPVGLLLACTSRPYSSGNGASAWGWFAMFAAGVAGTLALVGLILLAMLNPVVAAAVYGSLCLGIGIKMGVDN